MKKLVHWYLRIPFAYLSLFWVCFIVPAIVCLVLLLSGFVHVGIIIVAVNLLGAFYFLARILRRVSWVGTLLHTELDRDFDEYKKLPSFAVCMNAFWIHNAQDLKQLKINMENCK